jgi:hypothetical protein
MNEAEMRKLFAEKVKQAGSILAFAKQAGISSAYVFNAYKGKIAVGGSILDALGLEKVVEYRQIGPGVDFKPASKAKQPGGDRSPERLKKLLDAVQAAGSGHKFSARHELSAGVVYQAIKGERRVPDSVLAAAEKELRNAAEKDRERADNLLTAVDSIGSGRTRYEGQEPYRDEVLAAEVRRLRSVVEKLMKAKGKGK